GVSPDEICEEYGADTLRLYEMFMAPFDKEKLWDSQAMSGCHRFLQRFHDMVFSEKICEEEELDGMKLAHRLLDGVTKDIENLSFNTAIAKMMEFLNAFIPLNKYPRKALLMATQALYPFAPHFGEEAYEYLSGKSGITFEPLPMIDQSLLVDDTTTYVGQINGKVRVKWELAKGLSKEDLLEKLKGDDHAAAFLKGKIVKVIFVPNKLINVVVK
ncbi:MAG: class I tRNA ligase family protein, partial [Simkaniaceae bacterium]|nr:class I tRNA ligase family protein [Simkaniaceae bacterium]